MSFIHFCHLGYHLYNKVNGLVRAGYIFFLPQVVSIYVEKLLKCQVSAHPKIDPQLNYRKFKEEWKQY